MSDPRTLRRLHDDLRATADALTRPGTRPVWRDDGTVTTHPADPLLTQLRQAVAPGGERGEGRGRGAGLPLDVDAADLLAQLEADATRLHLEALAAEHSLEDRIRAIATIVSRWTDEHQVAVALDYLRRWAADIGALLDPPRRLHVAAPCPACGVRMVTRHDEHTGQTVQVPALTVDGQTGCHCQAPHCGTTWPPDQLEHLALVLGCDPLPTA